MATVAAACLNSARAIHVYHFCCCLVVKSRLTLCDPTDCSSPGSSIHGISQARILQWVAISSSRGSRPSDRTRVSSVSSIGRKILYLWDTSEALCIAYQTPNHLQTCILTFSTRYILSPQLKKIQAGPGFLLHGNRATICTAFCTFSQFTKLNTQLWIQRLIPSKCKKPSLF